MRKQLRTGRVKLSRPDATRGTLSLKRHGEFSVKTYGDNHCGVAENLLVKYDLTVECAATTDERGFLFDQLTIDNFFKSIKVTKLSCEQFAISCSRQLWRVIHEENPGCVINSMSLMLSPAPHAASMTFTFDTVKHGKTTKVV